ncbi:MAG: DUF5050 domain-containing protein [Ruminococcaceae bacterium]|nr:DUF5050 domain-containing protein [Oscillospiraceae bacterium]
MKKSILKYVLIAFTLIINLTAIFLVLFYNRSVIIPDVTEKNINQATTLLEDAGFKIKTSTVYSDKVSESCVISQDKDGGSKAKYGTEINIVVSKGIEQITLPDVNDCTVAEAEDTLKKLGFSVITNEDYSSTINKGNVISQSVPAGYQADKGSTITITVSKGANPIAVPNTIGTTPSNANNFGKITTQDGWVYFAGSKNSIYRMRNDKSEIQLICDSCAVSLNVIGEWLYFADGSSKGGIYKIKIDGSEKTKLSSVTSYRVYVENEWIYYTSEFWGGKLYKMKTDGSSVTQILNEDCSEFIVYGEYIYYVSESNYQVYKCGLDGQGKTIFCVGFGGTDLALVDEKLVISDKYTIQSVNVDGSDYASFGTTNVQYSMLNGYDGWVYYLVHNFRGANTIKSSFGRMKPDGSQQTKILDYDYLNHANSFLNVADGWIYFQNEHKNDELYRVNFEGTIVERVG